MRWIGFLCAVGLALVGHRVRAEEPRGAPAEGSIETDTGRVELLSERIPVGRRIELPEGWYRVEEEGSEEGAVGSFTVLRAEVAPAREAPPHSSPPSDEAARPGEARLSPGSTAMPAPTCQAQRSAFFRALWKESGVDVDDPGALLEGLDAGASGPAAGYDWLALQADPIRDLAWSSELRDRAAELARCVRELRAASR